MAHEFRLPDIGEGLTEAEIVRWLIAEGEYVGADQPIVEVETDKAVVEIPSPYAGVVLRHGAAQGETVAVGSVLVVVGDPEEAGSDNALPQAQAPVVAEPADVESAPPIVGTLEEHAEELAAPVSAPTDQQADAVKALPIVRKLARDLGIDLARVHGSGPGGRITREDVLAVAEGAQVELAPQAAATEAGSPAMEQAPVITDRSLEPEEVVLDGLEEMSGVPGAQTVPQVGEETNLQDAPTPDGDERRLMSRLRRTIAANMSRSWAEVPHVTTFDDVDATRLFEVRGAMESRYSTKIPLEALIVKAVIPALEAFPEFNATLEGDELVMHKSYDVGIAVDTPDGLLVAVIRNAASKGVRELAADVQRLGDGAKERALTPDELSGQTFTISNIGAVGGGHGTPIVPPGTTAILSVGRAKQKPIIEGGELVIAPLMPLSLSYDHRVIDGGLGRRFMAQIMENLEEPALFLAT